MQTVKAERWGLEVLPENIPEQLKKLNRWIVWKAEPRKDKVTKIPLQANSKLLPAATNNLKHCTDFTSALQIYHTNSPLVSGLGFVLTQRTEDEHIGFFGIDLDHCITEGKLSSKAQKIVDGIQTYWEISPSNTGLRCFGIGKLPGKSFNNQKSNVEMYNGDSARFLTVTGHRLPDIATEVLPIDLSYLEPTYAKYCTSNNNISVKVDTTMPALITMPAFIKDMLKVIDLSLNSHHKDFLIQGEVSPQYASRSEALLAAIMAMYGTDLNDAEILSVLVDLPVTYDIALDHRQQNDSKALAYLWQQCIAAKQKVGKPVSLQEFKSEKSMSIKQTLIDRYVYIISSDKYYDTTSGLFVTKQALTTAYKHVIYSAHTFLSLNANTQKMDSLIYCPGRSEKEILWNRKRCLNIWQAPQLTLPDSVTEQGIATWLNHADYLIPDNFERHHFFDWMAFTLQHQNKKINHGILFAGTTRIGKDTLIQPLIEGLGDDNVSQPEASVLQEQYTDYLHHSKLVIFQEIENFEKREIENKLKPMLAAPPRVLTIRLFGKGFYDTPNIVCAIFMSNRRNAMKISKNDGRYFAIWCDVTQKEESYYKMLWSWLDDGGRLRVVRWLLQRDLSQFNPSAPAPITSYKKQIIELGRTNTEMRLQKLISDAQMPLDSPIVQYEDLKQALNQTLEDRGRPVSDKELANLLAEMDVVKREIKVTVSKYSRKKYTLWLLLKHPYYQDKMQNMSGNELMEIWKHHTEVLRC